MKHDRPVLGEGTREGRAARSELGQEEEREEQRLRGSTDVGQGVCVCGVPCNINTWSKECSNSN